MSEIDETALKAAARAIAEIPPMRNLDQARAALLAYESSRSQSSDARDEWIDVPEQELSPALLEVIAETRGKIAIAMMGVYPTRKFKVALKRPADRKGGQ